MMTYPNATAAYDFLRAEIFPKVTSYFRLFKTPQSRQDEYVQIRALYLADEATFTPSIFRAERDLIDMLMSVGIPPHVRHVGETLHGNPTIEKINVIAAWRREPDVQRARLSGLCYWPGGGLVIDSRLNTFRDVSVPAIAPPDEHALDDILNHIRNNICNGKEAYSEYLLKWLAHMVQFPAVRPKTAIAVLGGQGTGKGIFIDFIKLVLGGERNCNTTASSTDTKAFNVALANKLFVVFDEATFAGDRQQSDFMKKLVTEPRIRVEPKGVDAYEVENFVRVFITSNNMNSAVPVGVGGRRWLIIECKNDVERSELKKLATKIGNNGRVQGAVEGYASWFKHYLGTMDLENFDPLELPMQDTGFTTKLNVLYKEDPLKAFLWEWLVAEDLTLYRSLTERDEHGQMVEYDSPLKWEPEVFFADFYEVFSDHCKASFAYVPARNRIRELMAPYGGTTVRGAQGTSVLRLPHPATCLAILRKTARFDDPISKEQLEVLVDAWREPQPRKKGMPTSLVFAQQTLGEAADYMHAFDIPGAEAL